MIFPIPQQLKKGMSLLTHVPNYQTEWPKWFARCHRFLQWVIHTHLTEQGKHQLYAAAPLEFEKPDSDSAIPAKPCCIARIADRFQNLWTYNYGSLVHRFLRHEKNPKPREPRLSDGNVNVVNALEQESSKLGPEKFHELDDVIKPLLRVERREFAGGRLGCGW